MALRDHCMLELARMIDTEEFATDFTRENGILLFLLIKILFELSKSAWLIIFIYNK